MVFVKVKSKSVRRTPLEKTCNLIGSSPAAAHTPVGAKDSFGEDLNQLGIILQRRTIALGFQ
jgi:hypothetical protein